MTNKTGGKHVPGAKRQTRAYKVGGSTIVIARCWRPGTLRVLVAGPKVQRLKVCWAFVGGVGPGWGR